MKTWISKVILFFLITMCMTFGQDCLSPDYVYDECVSLPSPHMCVDDCNCNAGRCCSPFGWCQDANSEWCVATSCDQGLLECWDGSCVGYPADCPQPSDCSEQNDCPSASSGDINDDDSIDVIDIVQIVNVILLLSVADDCETETGDINGDGALDVLDIIMIVNIILTP